MQHVETLKAEHELEVGKFIKIMKMVKVLEVHAIKRLRSIV